MAPIRLFLVEDHLMLAEALATRLSLVPELWVVGRATSDDPQLTEVITRLRPDVITIDPRPAGSAAGALLRRLVSAAPKARLVVLTGECDTQRAIDAARAGVAAWVRKDRSVSELVEVLIGVCRGHSWFPPEVLGEILRALRADIDSARRRNGLLDALSQRERDVLLGMVEGKRGAQIAEELRISTDTVRTHTRSILSKLQVHSRLEAVSVARAAGIQPPERPATPRIGPVVAVPDGHDSAST